MTPANRQDCIALDQADPLASLRDLFFIPDGLIYLDGNSLGVLPKATAAAVASTIQTDWGVHLITSWNRAGWMDMAPTIAANLGQLVGAKANEMMVCDSTSINLFKVLGAALSKNKSRKKIVSERGNFPTDLYIAEGLGKLIGQGHELVLIDDMSELATVLDPNVAVVMLTQIDYRTGRKLDMAAVTKTIHACGALVIWDLAHSAGAFEVDLNGARADYAVGCGYKYLNGGPGAPAFVFVATEHLNDFDQPLSGWLGHAAPFQFEPGYRPAPGVQRAICGTPPVLSMVALEQGVKATMASNALGGMKALESKARALTELFANMAAPLKQTHGLQLVTPKQRGNQISFSLDNPDQAYAVVQALIAQKVIGDFRAPNIMRFGFAPLYLRYVDIWDAGQTLINVLQTQSWNKPEFVKRNAVT
jgi:kynureninase